MLQPTSEKLTRKQRKELRNKPGREILTPQERWDRKIAELHRRYPRVPVVRWWVINVYQRENMPQPTYRVISPPNDSKREAAIMRHRERNFHDRDHMCRDIHEIENYSRLMVRKQNIGQSDLDFLHSIDRELYGKEVTRMTDKSKRGL